MLAEAFGVFAQQRHHSWKLTSTGRERMLDGGVEMRDIFHTREISVRDVVPRRELLAFGLLVALLGSSARAEPTQDTAPEVAFFREGGGVVAHHHFVGPMNPMRSAWIRRDGRVLTRGAPGGAGQTMLPLLDGQDATGAAETSRWRWRESQIDVALVKKIERLARASGLCKAKSTPGFSVGGAWTLGIDFGAGLRCAYRRRARLVVEGPIEPLRNAVLKALDAALAAPALHEGARTDPWELGEMSPMG